VPLLRNRGFQGVTNEIRGYWGTAVANRRIVLASAEKRAPLLLLWSLLNFYDQACERLVTCEQHLMRRAGGNVRDVAGSELLLGAAGHSRSADLTETDGFGISYCAAGNQRGPPIQNKKQISELFMHFGNAAADANREHNAVLWILSQCFAGGSVSQLGKLAEVGCALQ